jgi:cytochrome P450
LRRLISELTAERRAAIADGTAPADLATDLMIRRDPQSGTRFEGEEVVDQVATFLLAGHETTASALSWALYLLATHPDWQDRLAAEAAEASLAGAGPIARNVFREALRLYPPVPMIVRECARVERFRGRELAAGTQIVLSPWHLHRHKYLWDNPDQFDPGRWARSGSDCRSGAFLPFSAGPRACPGVGFAMLEGPLILSHLLRAVRLEPVPGDVPEPVAHLTVRSRKGIRLCVAPRASGSRKG